MKAQIAFTFSLAALALYAGDARAEPPVNVEILDEEAEDFFSEPEEEEEAEEEEAPAEKSKKKSKVEADADAMFEELEANTKGGKIRRAKKAKKSSSGDD